MINSTERQLTLSGWLKNNNVEEYHSPLKLQKFLLFYELFTKVSGETADFNHLRGYKRGPVFSNVWGDYTKERFAFNRAADNAFREHLNMVNEIRAKKTAFIVSVLSERELSDLTHTLNLWRSKKERILSDEYQVALEEKDFSSDDAAIMELLDEMYPIEMIEKSERISIDNITFVLPKEDFANLTEEMLDVLSELAEKHEKNELHNPVYVTIEEGRLVID